MTAAANGRRLDFLAEELQGCTLTAAEAVRMAESWWNKLGRHMAKKIANKSFKDTAKGPGANGAPAIFIKGTGEVEIPSKILEGLHWDELGRRERAAVTKAWLSQYREVYAPGKILRVRH